MTNEVSRMVVERVDVLPSRAGWMFVTGVLSGDPVNIGDQVTIRNGDQATLTTIKSIELHSRPGKTTIVLDADLRSIVTAGTVIQRQE
ncbi:hypothetical protein [Nocardia abscessus]|uniref:hypothetical protein n=1 Tax=Nocardia abscessus TaxID=120957 RepID=UPI0002F56DF0|nr:hypothetical protein [Nocardia abscessus]MCC3332937.1 hypothetical protein [Nocardia abscessus]